MKLLYDKKHIFSNQMPILYLPKLNPFINQSFNLYRSLSKIQELNV